MEWIIFLGLPVLWLEMVFVSPFLTVHRPYESGLLSILAGALMFVSIKFHIMPFFWAGVIAGAAMMIVAFWPKKVVLKPSKRKNQRKKRNRHDCTR